MGTINSRDSISRFMEIKKEKSRILRETGEVDSIDQLPPFLFGFAEGYVKRINIG